MLSICFLGGLVVLVISVVLLSDNENHFPAILVFIGVLLVESLFFQFCFVFAVLLCCLLPHFQ